MSYQIIKVGVVLVCLTSFVWIPAAYSQSTGPVSDRQADSLELVRFYHAMDGPNWKKIWDLNEPMNTWNGIFMRGNRVIGINLRRNELSGNLEDLLLPELRHLELNHNRLTGNVPKFLDSPFLIGIALGSNDLTGSIPDYNHLDSLRALDLSNNSLEGELPALKNSIAMDFINCISNRISGVIPDYGSVTPELSKLLVSDNCLTFSSLLPNYFSILENLGGHQTINDTFHYIPQRIISLDSVSRVQVGQLQIFDLNIDDTVSTNTYFWFKDDQPYDTIVGSNKLVISDVQISDGGLYRVEITNSIITDLTLYTSDVELIVESPSATTIEYEPAIEIYPNPAFSQLIINSDEAIANWTILSLDGRENLVGKGKVVDVSCLPVGSYVIEIIISGQSLSRQFAKH